MLSPGQFWQRVPKERAANLRFRKELLLRSRQDNLLRAGYRAACRQDLLFYVNAFVWTFDPRTQLKLLPFVTWPVQDRAFLTILDCIEQGRDLVIEKSRDMGASWMSLVVMEWLWHFHPGMSFLMVSRKEGLVDAPGDPDSLFWKVDFVHKHLPLWLRPETDRRRLHFGNVGNGSTIDGESTTAAAGVGGRRTAMFIDEFSRIEEGYQLLAGTADTTRCRIFNFTPYGTNNAAYDLARREDVKKLRLHWSEHPEKAAGLYRSQAGKVEVLDALFVYPPDFNFTLDGRTRSPWYDGECRRRANEREVAQMLDIDYQGSAYQFFDRWTIQTLMAEYCVPAYWEGDVLFDPDTGKFLGLERREGGPLRLWCHLSKDDRPPPGKYAAGADLSTGSGATNSCFAVVDCTTGEKVAEYTSPFLRSEQMAPRCVALCWAFKDEANEGALFAWEYGGPGVVFGKEVVETYGYRNIYYRRAENRIEKKVSDFPGWYPNPDLKTLLLQEYRAALSTRQMVNRSKEALEETLKFIHDKNGQVLHAGEIGGNDPSGARANHGDRVIADALAWKMAMMRDVQKKKEEVVEVEVGSLAWRRLLAESRNREEKAWA